MSGLKTIVELGFCLRGGQHYNKDTRSNKGQSIMWGGGSNRSISQDSHKRKKKKIWGQNYFFSKEPFIRHSLYQNAFIYLSIHLFVVLPRWEGIWEGKMQKCRNTKIHSRNIKMESRIKWKVENTVSKARHLRNQAQKVIILKTLHIINFIIIC